MSNAMKKLTLVSALTLTWSWSALSNAQELGAEGDFTIGVERVFGLYTGHVEEEFANGTRERDPSAIGFAYQRSSSLLNVPRAAFDYFIIESLSLGGTLGFDSLDGDDDDNDDDDSTVLLFAPRVGYVIPFNNSWGVWLRGGLTYLSQEYPGNNELALLALTGEANFYYMPAPAVGFSFGPVLDLGLSGEREAGNAEFDYDERQFGIALGMFARF